jgi:ArsR family transcriptional regulator, arsenate/arsenite/antimonite-responsive transcriptional repressor / arsenate reductase (thioredoxin)
MAVYRLLMRRYPDAVPAGEIGRALDLKPSTTSVYLSALVDCDLATQRRNGTSLLYRVNMTAVRAMMAFLVNDCCRGRPDLCPTPLIAHGADPMPNRKYNVLFICTGNSARSIFAEALLRERGGDRFSVYSAGTRPRSELNPFALEMLKAKGHDISPLRAKNVDEFRQEHSVPLDFVFTVCDTSANEDCPPWDGQPISGHWGVPDPVKAEGTPAQKALAFQHAYGALKRRVELFAALPIETLDRLALQKAVDEIGTTQNEDNT